MSTCTIHFSPEKLLNEAKKALFGLSVFCGLVAVAHGCACMPITSPAEVDAAYRAELVGCSKTAPTLEASKACRRAVNTKYGLCRKEDWPRISPCDDLVEE